MGKAVLFGLFVLGGRGFRVQTAGQSHHASSLIEFPALASWGPDYLLRKREGERKGESDRERGRERVIERERERERDS